MYDSPDFETKYTPTRLSEYVFPSKKCQDEITDWIQAVNYTALLLHGINGTGKTTLANMLFYELYPDSKPPGDIVTIEADSRKDTATKLKSIRLHSSMVNWIPGCKRAILINEIDNYAPDVQRSMKGIFDQYRGRVHYILTTNHFNNVRGGLRDRSHVVCIGPANRLGWLRRSKWIFKQEGLSAPCDADILSLIDKANGSGRNIIKRLAVVVSRAHQNNAANLIPQIDNPLRSSETEGAS